MNSRKNKENELKQTIYVLLVSEGHFDADSEKV